MQIIFIRVGQEATAAISSLGASATLLYTATNGRWQVYQVDTSGQDIETIRRNLGPSYLGSTFIQLP